MRDGVVRQACPWFNLLVLILKSWTWLVVDVEL